MADLLTLPRSLAQTAFFASAPLTMALGLSVYLRAKGAVLFAAASLLHFVISIVFSNLSMAGY
jgi:hypothetical protein